MDTDTCQWCHSTDVRRKKTNTPVINAQVDEPYTLLACNQCGQLSLVAWLGNRSYRTRAIEQRRLLRSSRYVAIYTIACAWCGEADHMQPEDINATIANPASRRHRYDVYGCSACDNYTAIAYVGEVIPYRAIPDKHYHHLYYLDMDEHTGR